VDVVLLLLPELLERNSFPCSMMPDMTLMIGGVRVIWVGGGY
jgi:hypothetical protein